MKIEANDGIQGLATFHTKADLLGVPDIYIGHVEAAPWNQPERPNRQFKGIVAATLEAAIKESQRLGYNGRVSLVAERETLLGLYAKMGMKLVDPDHRVFVFDEEGSKEFLGRMEASRAAGQS